MRRVLVFIAAVSCGGTPLPPPPPPAEVAPAPVVARHVVRHPIDAAVPDAAPTLQFSARGGACGECAAGLTCLGDLPGGYCASACELGAACGDGARCIATPRDGDVCARTCLVDSDCRADEGYTCDPAWHTCAVPGFAAIAVKQCAAAGSAAAAGMARDAAFGSAEIVDAGSDAAYARSPAVVVGGDGAAVIVSVVGSGSGEQRIGTSTVGNQPALAKIGEAIVMAYRGDAKIWIATSKDRGSSWSEPIDVGAECVDGDCPERPRLAAAPRALYVAYSSDAIGTRVRASHDGGATWSAPITALTGARGDLATGGDGRVHVIAMTGGSGGAYGAAQHAIEYTASSDGGRSFAPATAISARDELVPAYFANPTLALDDRRGWIYAAYARGGADGAWAIVVAASKDKGKTWTRTHVLDDGCAFALVPNLAVDPTTGALHLAWYDTRGADPGRFAHAVCAPGAIRCSVRGAIGSLPFAALDAGRLDARWVGDSESLVIDDRRHVLHATWTEPLRLDNGRVATRVVHATAKLSPR